MAGFYHRNYLSSAAFGVNGADYRAGWGWALASFHGTARHAADLSCGFRRTLASGGLLRLSTPGLPRNRLRNLRIAPGLRGRPPTGLEDRRAASIRDDC